MSCSCCSGNSMFDMNVEFCNFVPNNNHDKLSNRDKDDQHPISAITGLQKALDDINDNIENIEVGGIIVASEEEINEICNNIFI